MRIRGIHKRSERECARFIQTRAQAGKRGVLNDGGGLYLTVSESGTASWLFRYEKGGKRHDIGLGAVHTFSLAEAREKARMHRQQLHDGKDPLAEKRRAKTVTAATHPASQPFQHCAREFIKSREANWRSDKHRRDWENSLARYAYPIIGTMLVSDIASEHVLKILQPHWEARTETMMRVRSRIELIFDWAIAKKFCAAPNPAVWKANLKRIARQKGPQGDRAPCGIGLSGTAGTGRRTAQRSAHCRPSAAVRHLNLSAHQRNTAITVDLYRS
jgi:hypothetical protein